MLQNHRVLQLLPILPMYVPQRGSLSLYVSQHDGCPIVQQGTCLCNWVEILYQDRTNTWIVDIHGAGTHSPLPCMQ